MGRHAPLEIHLTPQEVSRLKAGHTVKVAHRPGVSRFSIRMMRKSEQDGFGTAYHDPSVDLVVDPHDIWDLEVDGGLLVDYRERAVHLTTPARGINDPTLEWPAKWPPEKPA